MNCFLSTKAWPSKFEIEKPTVLFYYESYFHHIGAQWSHAPIIQMSSNPQISKRLDKKQNFCKISPLIVHWSAGRRNHGGDCGFGFTLMTSRNIINKVRKFPQHQPLPKTSSVNFEKVKIGKNALTFFFINRTSLFWTPNPIIQMSSNPQVSKR